VSTAVTHVGCPRCRLRFTPAAALYIVACPECGDPPHPIPSLERTFGFRLVGPEDLSQEVPHPTAVSITLPEPDRF
jgi:hypothetical protein